ncbi:MAG: ABC transporter ATP-binding protein [Candidatus Aminicenantes bacterium]|nr:ABC transporter ATP-binding protein [Candidatus Aminicenantes bacterium]
MKLQPIIRAEKVNHDYKLGKTKISALKDIDLSINTGDFIVIAGPSGSGKTTLLNLIGLIDKPTSGEIWMQDINTSSKNLNSLHPIRRDKIGYIFQTFNLIPVLTVFDNVEYPLILQRISRQQRRKLVKEALSKVGLSARLRHHPRELSGGERQRVSIARAIVKNPALVLADEPTANLDSKTGIEILQLMQSLHDKENTTFVFSSHDRTIIEMAEKTVYIRDGAIQKAKEL